MAENTITLIDFDDGGRITITDTPSNYGATVTIRKGGDSKEICVPKAALLAMANAIKRTYSAQGMRAIPIGKYDDANDAKVTVQ